MASDQLTGAHIKIFCEYPNGDRRKIFEGINEQTGPGGSPDHAQATVKANELPRMAVSNTVISGGSKIVMAVKLAAADGMDASDCVVSLPVVDASGNMRYLNESDLGITTDLPAATPANITVDVGTGYTVPEGDALRIGGNTYFISLENDAA